MADVRRIGSSERWSDIVIHRGEARWVEVASDMSQDLQGQVTQVLQQIDATLGDLGSSRDSLIQVLIFLADVQHVGVLNSVWDQWVSRSAAPIRACVGASLGGGCLVEMIVSAAVD